MPAGGQHQLQAGCALWAAQCHHQRGEFGVGADRDALQKLEVVGGVHRLDVIRRCGSLLSDGCVARVSQHQVIACRIDPTTLQQRGQHLDPCAAAHGVGRDDASISTAGGGAQQQVLRWGQFGQGFHHNLPHSALPSKSDSRSSSA